MYLKDGDDGMMLWRALQSLVDVSAEGLVADCINGAFSSLPILALSKRSRIPVRAACGSWLILVLRISHLIRAVEMFDDRLDLIGVRGGDGVGSSFLEISLLGTDRISATDEGELVAKRRTGRISSRQDS